MKITIYIYGLIVSIFIVVCTSQSSAQVNLEIASQELGAKVQNSPDATIEYQSFQFLLSIDKFHSMVTLLDDQFYSSQFDLENILTFVTNNSAPMREGWSNYFRVKDSIAYNIRERLISFDTIDLSLATMALDRGSDYTSVPTASKETIWWDTTHSIETIDDQVVLVRPRGGSTIPLGDLDRSYLPWGKLLGPEGYLEGQTVAARVYEDNEIVITFTVGAGTPDAYCASEAFDMNRNWRPVRSWNHTPENLGLFIDREYVWKYSPETDWPALSYERTITPSGDVKVTLRVFSSWLHSCSNIDLRVPPRYACIYLENSNAPTFHEVEYLELVQPEDKLTVAFIKVIGDFGQDIPESDYIVDGIIDEKDIERVLQDLAYTQDE